MQFNDVININDVVLYVEDSDSDVLHIIVAFNNKNIVLPGNCQFELESDSVKRNIIGKEWSIKTQILDIVKWIFIQSFTNDQIETNFLYFSKLLQIIQSKQISKVNFGMLGEIIFAYHTQLDSIHINNWLNAKNRSFDFVISDHLYEIKTKSIVDSEVVLNLSYNQLTSIGNTNTNLILVDMNSSQYKIDRKTLLVHFQNLQLDIESLNRIQECLDVFDYMDCFNYNILKYSGPKIKFELDEKIISLNCKVKLDIIQDFTDF